MSRQILRKVTSAALIAALCAPSSAFAARFPTKHKYMKKPLEICDQGVFYVGGAPKTTPFHTGPAPGPNRSIIIGQMYVQFQVPMKSKAWPLIMVHGSGYTGACVQGTAGGSEGWSDYTVRNGIPTYVVDQSGRARSGFDKTIIHEAEYKISTGDLAGAQSLLPTIGGQWGSNAWTNWFGHVVGNTDNDVTTGQMVRHGAPARQSNGQPAPGQDPQCVNPPTNPAQPAHCRQLGRLPMEPEAPWAVDQAIASRTGNGAPAGLGTVTPDVSGHINASFLLNDRYAALDAYKFDVRTARRRFRALNARPARRPRSTAPTPGRRKPWPSWSRDSGGAVVATHSQSGSMGHHLVRILKEHGKLHLLKGLITIEGSCSLTGAGLAADGSDFKNIPYMAFKGDYTGTSTQCQDTVNAIKAVGGKAEYIQLDEAGWWQGSYRGPSVTTTSGPFAGVSHMMMIEDNPAPGRNGKPTNLRGHGRDPRMVEEKHQKPKDSRLRRLG